MLDGRVLALQVGHDWVWAIGSRSIQRVLAHTFESALINLFFYFLLGTAKNGQPGRRHEPQADYHRGRITRRRHAD